MSKLETTTRPDTRAEALVASYVRAGYAQVAPPILHPARTSASACS
jgi:hypothetical protein